MRSGFLSCVPQLGLLDRAAGASGGWGIRFKSLKAAAARVHRSSRIRQLRSNLGRQSYRAPASPIRFRARLAIAHQWPSYWVRKAL